MERIDTIISKKTKSETAKSKQTRPSTKKNFIFDTNVILHDYK